VKTCLSKPMYMPGILLLILFGLFTVNANAINLMFLSKEAPARKFSDADWQYLNNAIDHSLANVADGTAYDWKNPASPASGRIEMLESIDRNGIPCRRVRLLNNYDQLKGVTEFVFCRQADGEWKVAQ